MNYILTMLIMLFCMILITLSYFLSMKNILMQEKLSPFECGFDPQSSSRLPFSMHFFMIGILFLIFDIEIVIILPMVITMKISNLIKWSISIIMIMMILLIGLIHEWKNGILEWTI
uniref:NADH-ubiquinone oxidoreductase chain 3 n=1 Tax=Aenictopecheidae sp. PJ-2015 TaxID=1663421 RepID=A0A3S6CLN7_9HEMI|nr:NADH dehydrogenase subunit 3 [Aenictopecheidae sp. PJ-2015]